MSEVGRGLFCLCARIFSLPASHCPRFIVQLKIHLDALCYYLPGMLTNSSTLSQVRIDISSMIERTDLMQIAST